jgi:hypothetical protein
MSDSHDLYVKLFIDDFTSPEKLRKSVKEIHLWKADIALEKCIDHLFKASDCERLNLYRLLCYLGSRIDEIKKGRPILRRSYENKYWGYVKYE